MPETLTNRNRCHKCDKTGKRKKDKLSKCGKCQAITYCSRECQVEDWSRHKDNCVPVMVKEYVGQGLGLVATKDIKMGEQILIDKAVLTEKDFVDSYNLDPETERLLLNQKILKDISLLNHSCAPNAAMGLLDGKRNKEPEKRFELRAINNISKDDEVTIYYRSNFPCSHAVIRTLIRKNFGFVCRCVVCSGRVPNQADIVEKICETVKNNRDVMHKMTSEEMTSLDWKRVAIVFGIISDLAKPLYMGREAEKMKYLFVLHKAAMNSGDSIFMKKALDDMKELADKTGLEMTRNAVEMMRKEGQTQLQMRKKDADVTRNRIRLAVVFFVVFFFSFLWWWRN